MVLSKIPPTYPWKIPRMFHQQFIKEFLSLWGFGEVWGIFPGYVGKIIETLATLQPRWFARLQISFLEKTKKRKPKPQMIPITDPFGPNQQP